MSRALWAVLAVYLAAFLISPPRALLVVDEELYVAQAVAFAVGARTIGDAGRRYEGMPHAVMSDYPAGTSLLQTPFVATLGWPFAALASVLSLIVATLATAALLRNHGRDPVFALLVPGFLGTSFFARTAMSDVPSAMIVALSLLCSTRAGSADDASAQRKLGLVGGFLAGVSVLFRELNVLLVSPFNVAA